MNVIYTAISKNYDRLWPHPPIKECQFIAFVDNPEKIPDEGWELRKLVPFHKDAVRNSKKYKVLAHEIFPHAKYSLWVDGNITIQNNFNLDSLIGEYLTRHDIALFKHRKRICSYAEADTCLRCGLDNSKIINKQIFKYLSEGYPKNHGLTENRTILRRHTPKIAQLENTWWKEICEGSRRDQLSLNYSMWKTGISFAILPGTSLHNPFFKGNKHLCDHRRFMVLP